MADAIPGEALVDPNSEFPKKYPEIWEVYKKVKSSFWAAWDMDTFKDLHDWGSLTEGEKHFITRVLAFLASPGDSVLRKLVGRFRKETQVAEARAFYDFQISIDDMHWEMFTLLLHNYATDDDERERMYQAIGTVPWWDKKAEWILRWIDGAETFADRLLALACLNGILFSCGFCAIYWLKKRDLMPGLTFSSEMMSEDEGFHCDFACLLYSQLSEKPSEERVKSIVRDSVDLEREFVSEALPCALEGMKSDLMSQYVEFVADRLLVAFGYGKMYNVDNTFDWMEMTSLQGNASFLERCLEYHKVCNVKYNSDGEVIEG